MLALYNAGANAPHVALNLRGQFVFADDRANVCLFGGNPDSVALIVRSALAPYLLKTITGLDQSCDPQNLETYDIVATQRGAFLKTAQADALSLIKQIENGAMRHFALISASDIAAAAAAERAAVEQIATDVAAGARNGFVVILLKSASPSLCVTVPEKNEAHAQLILRNADKLTFDMHVTPTLTMRSAEDAFVGAQKRCVAQSMPRESAGLLVGDRGNGAEQAARIGAAGRGEDAARRPGLDQSPFLKDADPVGCSDKAPGMISARRSSSKP